MDKQDLSIIHIMLHIFGQMSSNFCTTAFSNTVRKYNHFTKMYNFNVKEPHFYH